MTMKRVSRPNSASRKERVAATLGRYGFIHLAACLGTTAAVVIALVVIGWLT